MRKINADELEKWMDRDDWGSPDERWRPESEFGAIIDAQPTVDGWISVDERLPEKGVKVLICWDTGYVNIGDRFLICQYLNDKEITHWMPLPEPPEEYAKKESEAET